MIFKKSFGKTKGILSSKTTQNIIININAWLTFDVQYKALAIKKHEKIKNENKNKIYTIPNDQFSI